MEAEMATLTLMKHPSPRSKKLVLSNELDSGKLVYQGQLNPFDPRDQRAAAAACGVDLQVILDLIQNFQRGTQPATVQIADPDTLPTG
jgi:hypothetical protein